jgi:hypothetical protein
MDCSSSVIRRLSEEKFSCGQTKCESVVVNVLALFAMQQIFEELGSVMYRMNISKTRMDEWNTKSLTAFDRWSEILEFVQSECVSLKNAQLILEFSFAISGTSAAIERVFSITNALWTDKRAISLLKP